jgi:flagellin
MRINHNIASLNSYRQLSSNAGAQNKSLEKLSSGLRINRAGDDAAGLAISEKMRGQIRGLDQATRNAQDGISLIQTAEGALSETHSILQRMRELMVQANNGTNTASETAKIKQEMDELVNEIGGIADRTEFNGKALLKGTVGLKLDAVGDGTLNDGTLTGYTVDVSGASANKTYTFAHANNGTTLSLTDGTTTQIVTLSSAAGHYAAGEVLNFDKLGIKITLGSAGTFGTDAGEFTINGTTLITEDDATLAGKASMQIGANSSQTLDISIGDMRSSALGTVGGSNLKINALDVTDFTTHNFTTQLTSIDDAITQVSTERSKLGAYQNRLEHTISNLATSSENLTASESRVRDVDMAKEMMEFTKNNILQQAATAMLAQANQQPQGVLQLLR